MSGFELTKRHLARVRKSNATPASANSIVPHALIQRATTSPHSLPSSDILYLQRTLGNNALSQMLRAGNASLTVGDSNDRFEQEADRVSGQVTASVQNSTVQRVQTQTPVGIEGGAIDNDLTQRIQRAQAGGSPAPEHVRRAMEEQTGSDFSEVRVHHDHEANSISEALGAKAATHGKHIFLGREQSPNDLRLMAHEMTHTIQQGAVKGGSGQAQPAGAKSAPGIQRDDDEKKIKKLNKKIGGAKAKKGVAKVGEKLLTGLDMLVTSPFRLIDQASVLDLHLKDFVNFVKTGKTRKQRAGSGAKSGNFKQSSRKRRTGRTGLRALLSGVTIHERSTNPYLPWHGMLNPFLAMGKGQAGLGKIAEGYGKDIGKMRDQKQNLRNKMNQPPVNPGLQHQEDIAQGGENSVDSDVEEMIPEMIEGILPEMLGEEEE